LPIMRFLWLVGTLALLTVGILTLPGVLASGDAELGGSSTPGGGGAACPSLPFNAYLTRKRGSGVSL